VTRLLMAPRGPAPESAEGGAVGDNVSGARSGEGGGLAGCSHRQQPCLPGGPADHDNGVERYGPSMESFKHCHFLRSGQALVAFQAYGRPVDPGLAPSRGAGANEAGGREPLA
jgi:hypothetical protein